MVNSEGKPGNKDDHPGQHIDGDDVEGQIPGKHQVHLEATILP